MMLELDHNPGPHVFISYSREDVGVARDLHERISALGHTPWMDLFDVPAGARWPDEIDQALRSARVIVGLLSPASLRSENVKNEWDWAIANSRRLILLLIEPCQIPFHYVSRNHIDFTADQGSALAELARALDSVPDPRRSSSSAQGSGPVARGRRASPSLSLGPTPVLVGREGELTYLRQIMQAAFDGEGGLFLLAGEAGIGKTTLSTAIGIEAAGEGMLVLTGGCYDLATTPPYGPWAEIARAYPDGDGLPPLPDALRAGSDGLGVVDSQTALFDLVARFLVSVAEHRPLLIVLEDLHWADQASLDLLRYLSRVLLKQRILLLATYRDDELTREHPLFSLIPMLVREGRVHRLSLQRLSREAVQELVRERYRLTPEDEDRLTAYLGRLAEGNPFFTNELLHTLDEQQLLSPIVGGWEVGDLNQAGVPVLVQQVIERRLTRLDQLTRELLNPLAVIGYEIPLDLIERLHSGTASELDTALGQAIEHHIVFQVSGQRKLRFSHALVRQTIYEGIPPLGRQYLHLEIGRLLADRPQSNPTDVANHLYQAGDKRAIEWLIRAAEQAQAVYAPQTVLIQCGRAIELAGQHGHAAPIAAYRRRGRARELSGDFDGALDDHETALQLSRDRSDEQAEWQGLLDLGMLWASRDLDRMADYCRQAVDLARIMGDPHSLGHSLNRPGNWHANALEPYEGLRHHEEALAIFERLDDYPGIAATLDLISVAHFYVGDTGATLHDLERAMPILRQTDDRQTLGSALVTVTEAAGIQHHKKVTRIQNLCEMLGADPGQLLAEAVSIAQHTGSRSAEAFALGYGARWQATIGNFQQAVDIGQRAVEIAEEIRHLHWIGITHNLLGLTHSEVFALDRASAMLERADQVWKLLRLPAMSRVGAALLASACVLDGQYSRARQLLDVDVDPRKPPHTIMLRHYWYAYAELALALKQCDDALAIIDGLIDSIPGERGVLSPQLTCLRGEALLALGRLNEADAVLAEANEDALQIGYPVLIWQSWASLRKLRLEQGRIDEAEEAREEALAVIDKMAASLEDHELRQNFLEQARARLPETLPFTARRSYGGLTEREMEVLRLVNEGLTDAQIAEQLYISPRTVSAHVTNVLGKLNAANRTAASRIAVERGLIE